MIDILSRLSPECEDDDLEDWLHYAMESCQFAGFQVLSDEVDIDQVVCDLRTSLEQLHSVAGSASASDDHLFLVLDKQTQMFPWESLSCLKDRSVSRVPSLRFIYDRMAASKTQGCTEDRHTVNAKKAFFVLNPGGDLKATQNNFETWLNKRKDWSGITGRIPMEIEMSKGLQEKDLFLYFGHGGGEQYIRSQSIRQLDRCATTFLFGCSSGALREMGDFDATGTPWNYMIGGCPMLVANLWDVTDKDIDRFTKSVFSKLGFDEDAPQSETSAPMAVAQSREVCTMRYLNGAAPVIFGIPTWFRS